MVNHSLAFVEKKERQTIINIIETHYSLKNVSDGLNDETLYLSEADNAIYRYEDDKLIAKVIEIEDGDVEFSNFRWG